MCSYSHICVIYLEILSYISYLQSSRTTRTTQPLWRVLGYENVKQMCDACSLGHKRCSESLNYHKRPKKRITTTDAALVEAANEAAQGAADEAVQGGPGAKGKQVIYCRAGFKVAL